MANSGNTIYGVSVIKQSSSVPSIIDTNCTSVTTDTPIDAHTATVAPSNRAVSDVADVATDTNTATVAFSDRIDTDGAAAADAAVNARSLTITPFDHADADSVSTGATKTAPADVATVALSDRTNTGGTAVASVAVDACSLTVAPFDHADADGTSTGAAKTAPTDVVMDSHTTTVAPSARTDAHNTPTETIETAPTGSTSISTDTNPSTYTTTTSVKLTSYTTSLTNISYRPSGPNRFSSNTTKPPPPHTFVANDPRNKNNTPHTHKPLHYLPQYSSQFHNTTKIRSPLLPTPTIPKYRPSLLPTPSLPTTKTRLPLLPTPTNISPNLITHPNASTTHHKPPFRQYSSHSSTHQTFHNNISQQHHTSYPVNLQHASTYGPSHTFQNTSSQSTSYQHPSTTISTNPTHINNSQHHQSHSYNNQISSVNNPSTTNYNTHKQQQSPQLTTPQQTHINNLIKMVSLILINSFEQDYNETNISLTLDRARQYASATGFVPPIQFYDSNEARIQRAATAISALLPYSDIIQLTPSFFL